MYLVTQWKHTLSYDVHINYNIWQLCSIKLHLCLEGATEIIVTEYLWLPKCQTFLLLTFQLLRKNLNYSSSQISGFILSLWKSKQSGSDDVQSACEDSLYNSRGRDLSNECKVQIKQVRNRLFSYMQGERQEQTLRGLGKPFCCCWAELLMKHLSSALSLWHTPSSFDRLPCLPMCSEIYSINEEMLKVLILPPKLYFIQMCCTSSFWPQEVRLLLTSLLVCAAEGGF